MPRPLPFKPCHELRPSDFQAFPVWGFNLERGETLEGADETWVQPWTFKRLRDIRDDIFVRSYLSPSGGRARTSCLIALSGAMDWETRRVRLPAIEGFVLWTPRYQFFQLVNSVELKSRSLRKYRPEFFWTDDLPVTAKVQFGETAVTTRGRLSRDDHAALFLSKKSRAAPLLFEATISVGSKDLIVSGQLENA